MSSGGDAGAGTADVERVFSPAGGVLGKNISSGGEVYRGEEGATWRRVRRTRRARPRVEMVRVGSTRIDIRDASSDESETTVRGHGPDEGV